MEGVSRAGASLDQKCMLNYGSIREVRHGKWVAFPGGFNAILNPQCTGCAFPVNLPPGAVTFEGRRTRLESNHVAYQRWSFLSLDSARFGKYSLSSNFGGAAV
jgi:hypothetical protein